MLSEPEIKSLLKNGTLVALPEAVPTVQRENKVKTPWIHNPEDLEGYDIDTLNALIQESDKDCDSYETVEEAIAHLSMDFEEWNSLSNG